MNRTRGRPYLPVCAPVRRRREVLHEAREVEPHRLGVEVAVRLPLRKRDRKRKTNHHSNQSSPNHRPIITPIIAQSSPHRDALVAEDVLVVAPGGLGDEHGAPLEEARAEGGADAEGAGALRGGREREDSVSERRRSSWRLDGLCAGCAAVQSSPHWAQHNRAEEQRQRPGGREKRTGKQGKRNQSARREALEGRDAAVLQDRVVLSEEELGGDLAGVGGNSTTSMSSASQRARYCYWEARAGWERFRKGKRGNPQGGGALREDRAQAVAALAARSSWRRRGIAAGGQGVRQ